MKVVGKIESLWRYPVKSMRGEELQEAFVGFPGVYGDRLYAFRSSAAPKGFPYLTAREQEAMLLYRPRYRHPERAAKPGNLAEAEARGSGVTPLYADLSDLMVDVETPAGERLAIDDPRLISMLREGIGDRHELTLLRSARSMTDCRPVSIFSIQTVRQLSKELGIDVDKRQFRANLYVDLESGKGFGEDEFVDRALRIGARTVIAVLQRDSRCKISTLDPDTRQPNPEVMRRLARDHEGKAGIYGAVLVEGTIRPGDEITLLDWAVSC
ncbi:MAG: MOSC domain-containing protein [Bryobacteraceae bacterium]